MEGNRPTASPAISPAIRTSRFYVHTEPGREGYLTWKCNFLRRMEAESSEADSGKNNLVSVLGDIAALPVGLTSEVNQPLEKQ